MTSGTRYKLTVTFTEPLLGTAPLNPEVYTDYIASRAPGPVPDEVETLEEAVERGTTGFHKRDGAPILMDYMLKGFAKDACSMLARVKGSESAKLRPYRKIIDGLLFVTPREIPLALSAPVAIQERPLRAQTPQGERIALARSEVAPAGTTLTCELLILDAIPEELLREWLDYGRLRGLGVWRNGGYGRFTHTLERLS